MSEQVKKLWTPSLSFAENSNLSAYKSWLKRNYQKSFANYHELWQWSINDVGTFWESIWKYFDIRSYSSYEQVVAGDMPDAEWFKGATINYAEHIFRHRSNTRPAIIFKQEGQPTREISWAELESAVGRLIAFLKSNGVRKGDTVAAYLPNIPEATMMFLACNAMGVIWSSCSPDFGDQSVVDRFRQIEPKILIATDGYRYGGKSFDRRKIVGDILDQLPTVTRVIDISHLGERTEQLTKKSVNWREIMNGETKTPVFEPVPFDHPIWVLYSSGTTGKPKAITHSTGGVLLEHLKYLTFHNDVKKGEKFFWFTTTGWMMWNFVQAALLAGATIVLYDGSPAHPNLNALWDFAREEEIHHFGTSAPFILSCKKHGISPAQEHDMSFIRSISSTGAPLPPDGFSWVYENISSEVWLCSMSGGTDVCSAFIGGCPTEPVYEGEIQCRALGCAMYSWDEERRSLQNEVGEMVITKPMPSMPVYFWGDQDKKRYRESYFETYEGVWRHGDWLKITPRNSLVILGRSDATLNRHGIRIGTAEIYQVVDQIQGVQDSLVVNLEYENGDHFMPLFIVLSPGVDFDKSLTDTIKMSLRKAYSPRHVPDDIIVAPEIPYTISGKKMEAPVKKILSGRPIEKAAATGAMKNPRSLEFFHAFRERMKNKG